MAPIASERVRRFAPAGSGRLGYSSASTCASSRRLDNQPETSQPHELQPPRERARESARGRERGEQRAAIRGACDLPRASGLKPFSFHAAAAFCWCAAASPPPPPLPAPPPGRLCTSSARASTSLRRNSRGAAALFFFPPPPFKSLPAWPGPPGAADDRSPSRSRPASACT